MSQNNHRNEKVFISVPGGTFSLSEAIKLRDSLNDAIDKAGAVVTAAAEQFMRDDPDGSREILMELINEGKLPRAAEAVYDAMAFQARRKQ